MITTLKQKPYNYGIRKGKPPLTYYNITNCVTEIPERIQMYFNSEHNIVLEKDAILTVPYGKSAPSLNIGDTLNLNPFLNNLTIVDISWDGTQLFYYCKLPNELVATQDVNATFNELITVITDIPNIPAKLGVYVRNGNTYVGGTTPTTELHAIWYDTTNNFMKVTHDTGATWQLIPFPIGVTSITPYQWVSIDKVFNESGYLGNTIWYDKGFKGLMSNGRNDDRTLKNIPYTHEVVSTLTATDSGTIFISPNWTTDGSSIIHRALLYFEQDTPPDVTTNAVVLWRNPDANKNYVIWKNGNINDWMEIECIVLNDYAYSDNIIQGLTPLNPIELAPVKDLDGRWVKKRLVLASEKNILPNSSDIYDLSNYLPKDDNLYEVELVCWAHTGATTNNFINLSCYSDWNGEYRGLVQVRTRTNNVQSGTQTLRLVIGAKRTLTAVNDNGAVGTSIYGLRLYGYRKVR